LKAYVITLHGHEYSERVADRCIASAAHYSVVVEKWRAVDKVHALEVMGQYDLRWTWGDSPNHHPYGGPLETRVGCAMSHYLLWRHCLLLAETILILEHDSVFVRSLPLFDFKGICQINDPRGATRHGGLWSDQMAHRGPGVHPKTRVMPEGTPAREVIEKVHDIGLWPNDATICVQFFPYLQELYPFVTEVRQEQSTTNV
jgi:hypothetical protein